MTYELIHGDCIKVLREMEDNSVDAVVSDPPYGIEFMAKKWDYDVPSVEMWKECFRVLKPGGHLLSFAGSRTYHRMAVNIEDAGFEIRDQIMWIYGSGFPKSLNISKAIDKAAGVERSEVIGTRHRNVKPFNDEEGWNKNNTQGDYEYKAPATKEAKQWDGWGTALKPAHEPIVLARKPFKGTVAENVLEHGTSGLNIDGCRINTQDNLNGGAYSEAGNVAHASWGYKPKVNPNEYQQPMGRWPSNLIHDGSKEVVDVFPNTKSTIPSERNKHGGKFPQNNTINMNLKQLNRTGFDDKGSASRYFYCAKASKQERDLGLESFEDGKSRKWRDDKGMKYTGSGNLRDETGKNIHPTVKPVALMKYLCRLITPPNGVVIDPFMGSGTTGIAATTEGFNFIGIEREEEYIEIARHRIAHWVEEKEEVLREKRRQTTLF